ncbi:DNA polymerase II subunit B4-like [Malania oleifera]|uniref:DNA polymerase II subunit B4-like n=1 Tax=Malania oleifera TaxID=397392 RepID=UPI0025AE7079|nr:DNA polymerase II subunit B4-like [Malania oleifera]
MVYDKGSTGWYLKAAKSTQAPPTSVAASASASASASAPVSTAAQSSSTQELGSSSEAPSWFLSFQQDFSGFSSEARIGLQNIKAKVTSLDKWVTLIEKNHAKTSMSSNPMDISSASQSANDDDGDDDDDEGNSENEGDEENTEEEGTQEEGGKEVEKGDDSVEEY